MATVWSDTEFTAAVAHSGSNAYVGAGPGTGKTHLLVERYRRLRGLGVAGDRIVVLTFSRRAVIELRERLRAAGFVGGDVEVRTFHGFAARVLGGGDGIARTGRLLDGLSREALFDAALAATPTPTLAGASRSSERFASDLKAILADLERAPHATAAVTNEASPRLTDVLHVAAASLALRRRVGATDIGDLIGRAAGEVARPGSVAHAFVTGRYAHVLVDEFQDADRTQLDLLATLGAEIFAVGDEAQSIYRFRGASAGIVALAVERFAMRRFSLTSSRRCPPDVCALASQTPIPDLAPLHAAATDGEAVRVVRLRTLGDEVAWLADTIEADVASGREPASIAVLVRTFRPLGSLLVAELRRRSIAVASTGREELLADPRVATVRAALALFARPSDEAAWRALLDATPLRLDPLAVRFAFLRARPVFDETLPATLERVAGPGGAGAAIAHALEHARDAWLHDDLGATARRLVRGLGLLRAMLRDEPSRDVRAAATRLRATCDALANLQRTARAIGSPSSCAELVARIDDDFESLALDDAGLDVDAPGVRVLTIHAAKGLEFERVFVADAVEGRFPQDERRGGLLDDADRALLARHGVDGPTIAPEGARLEEASLWYVALTRARGSLTISGSDASLDGRAQRPSRFIPIERLPRDVTPVVREPLELRALRIGDAATDAALLRGDVLASAPALDAFAREGAAAFAPLPGIPIPPPKSISVGNAEEWLRCPRRVYYKRFVGLESEPGPSLTIGSVVHEILARFHATWKTFDASAIDVPRWTSELLRLRDEFWTKSDIVERFESPVVAAAAATTIDTRLRAYAQSLQSQIMTFGPFKVEQCEVTIDVTVGAHHLHGRVDRIDRNTSDQRRIVDYKVGNARDKTLEARSRKIVADWTATDGDREPLQRRLTKDVPLQIALYASAVKATSVVTYIYLAGTSDMESRGAPIVEQTPYPGDLQNVTNGALRELAADFLDPLYNARLSMMQTTRVLDNCRFCDYLHICPGPASES